jgi:hypothetical protein
VRYHEVASWLKGVADGPDNRVRIVAAADEVQDGHQQDG